jgi:hypothetical protein
VSVLGFGYQILVQLADQEALMDVGFEACLGFAALSSAYHW